MQVAVQGKQVSVTRSALPWRHRWTNLAPLMASFWWIRGGIVDIYILCSLMYIYFAQCTRDSRTHRLGG